MIARFYLRLFLFHFSQISSRLRTKPKFVERVYLSHV